MPSITTEITNAANATEQMKAKQPRVTGTTNLTSNDFLMLMMKQLQTQDPLSPVDNKDFIAQQAQFTQLSTTQEMSKNMATNNSIMQTLSLVGKEVSIANPDDPKNPEKIITGVVSEARFTDEGASIMVNGKEYPISLVKTVKEVSGTQNNQS